MAAAIRSASSGTSRRSTSYPSARSSSSRVGPLPSSASPRETRSETVSTAAFKRGPAFLERRLLLVHERHVRDDHALVDRLRHVVDGQRRHARGRQRLHLDPRLRRRLRLGDDVDAPLADGQLDVHHRERQRMAERDQVARLLRGHDPRELGGRQRVALRQVVDPARRLHRHQHRRPRGGLAPRDGLVADVDHLDVARGFVDVREVGSCAGSVLETRSSRRLPERRTAGRGRRAGRSPSCRRRARRT